MEMNRLLCISYDKREPNPDDFDAPLTVFLDIKQNDAPVLFARECSSISHLIYSENQNHFLQFGSRLTFTRTSIKQFFVNLSQLMLLICRSFDANLDYSPMLELLQKEWHHFGVFNKSILRYYHSIPKIVVSIYEKPVVEKL